MFNLNLTYETIEPLGEGATGSVWKCKENWTGRIVAIKYLKNLTDTDRERFRREARILTKLKDNPFVVDIYGFNDSDSQPYIVMEYCDGGSIIELTKNYETENHLMLLLALSIGLKAIHAEGGFHRDIKPDNILVKLIPNGICPKISDLGLARDLNPGTNMTQNMGGTMPYIAPEVLNGKLFTQKSDIYSLGVTMLKLITGDTDKSYNFTKIPFSFQSLLRRMFDDNPYNRPSCEQIEAEVRQIIIESQSTFGKIYHSFRADHAILGGLAVVGIFALLSSDD